MQVILLSSVKGLGAAGAKVDVAPGYAQNYLLPRKLAEPATATNLRRLAQMRTQQAEEAARDLEQAREFAARLEGQLVVVRAKAGTAGRLFGSVTPQDVADAVKGGFGTPLDRRRIQLEEPLKTVGDHAVSIRLHADVSAKIIVRVEPEP